MQANYKWKWDDEENWVEVYVNPQTGSVTEVESGYVYESRWRDFEDTKDICIQPITYPTKPSPVTDPVNNPTHYGLGKIECIEYIEDFLTTEEYIGYLRGNIAKYLHRWRYKNGLEDLEKAEWYLKRLIKVASNDSV